MINSFLVPALLLICSVASGSQDGLPEFAITSIDVQPVGGDAPKNRVKFHALIKGRENDDDAVILKDIVETTETFKGHPIFHATIITEGQLKRELPTKPGIQASLLRQKKKLLLCIHGFNVQPKSFLRQVARHSKKFHNYQLIPVIWPCEDKGVRGYLADRKNSRGAGNALNSILECYKDKDKSLMCHSMGNFVLKNLAEDRTESINQANRNYVPFENIFMVAADVRYDIFKKKVGGETPPILRLAKRNVYVLHSSNDKALWGRRAKNRGKKALGQDGFKKNHKVSDTVKAKVFNKDCNYFNKDLFGLAHSYQFKDEAINFYENPDIIYE